MYNIKCQTYRDLEILKRIYLRSVTVQNGSEKKITAID